MDPLFQSPVLQFYLDFLSDPNNDLTTFTLYSHNIGRHFQHSIWIYFSRLNTPNCICPQTIQRWPRVRGEKEMECLRTYIVLHTTITKPTPNRCAQLCAVIWPQLRPLRPQNSLDRLHTNFPSFHGLASSIQLRALPSEKCYKLSCQENSWLKVKYSNVTQFSNN
jgi:hypothetical protein